MVKVKHRDNLLFLLIALEVFVTMTPMMGYLLPPTIHIALWGIITLYIFIFKKSDYIKTQKDVLWSALAYIAVIFAYRLLGVSDAAWGNYLNQIMFFMPLILTFVVYTHCDNIQCNTLLKIVLLIVALNIADGIRITIENPSMTYMQLYSNDAEGAVSNLNVGNSDYMTMTLLYFNVALLAFFNTKKSFWKVVYLVFSIVSFYFILFVSLKATIIIYVLLSLVLQYMARRSKRPGKFIFWAVFTSVILIVLMKPITYLLINIIAEDRVSERLLNLVGDSMANKEALTGREDVYMLSVETWLSGVTNFIFGIGDHRSAFDVASTGIGQHSSFLDTLARYGLLGVLILFGYFKNLFEWMSKVCDKRILIAFHTIVIIIIMCGVTKELFSPPCGMAINFLLPLCLISFSKTNTVL